MRERATGKSKDENNWQRGQSGNELGKSPLQKGGRVAERGRVEELRPKRQAGTTSQTVWISEAIERHSDCTPSVLESHWRVFSRGII